jgi:hypothetical protein
LNPGASTLAAEWHASMIMAICPASTSRNALLRFILDPQIAIALVMRFSRQHVPARSIATVLRYDDVTIRRSSHDTAVKPM